MRPRTHRLPHVSPISPDPNKASSRLKKMARLLLFLVVPGYRHLETCSAARQGKEGMASSSWPNKSVLLRSTGMVLVERQGWLWVVENSR